MERLTVESARDRRKSDAKDSQRDQEGTKCSESWHVRYYSVQMIRALGRMLQKFAIRWQRFIGTISGVKSLYPCGLWLFGPGDSLHPFFKFRSGR